jgi:outer membrane murein-binding lipoprotein Lpp
LKHAFLPLVLLLSGCTKNHAELEARLAADDAQLAAQQSIAERLNESRRELEAAEAELARALVEFPEEQANLEEPTPPSAPPTFAPPPPESMFEGSEGARLRRQIQDTEARIIQLSKVLGEVGRLNGRREQVKRQLAHIRERHPPK